MRIVFMGTPDFAVPSLQALYDTGHEVAGVFCQPDRPKGRVNKVEFCPIKQLAVAHGTPVFQPQRIRKDGVDDLHRRDVQLRMIVHRHAAAVVFHMQRDMTRPFCRSSAF